MREQKDHGTVTRRGSSESRVHSLQSRRLHEERCKDQLLFLENKARVSRDTEVEASRMATASQRPTRNDRVLDPKQNRQNDRSGRIVLRYDVISCASGFYIYL